MSVERSDAMVMQTQGGGSKVRLPIFSGEIEPVSPVADVDVDAEMRA